MPLEGSTCVARYSTPPAGMQDGATHAPAVSGPIRPAELAAGVDDLKLAVEVVQAEDLEIDGRWAGRGRGCGERCRQHER